MLAVFKDRVVLTPWAIIGFLAFAHVFVGSALHHLLIYSSFLVAMLLAANSHALRALALPHDIS